MVQVRYAEQELGIASTGLSGDQDQASAQWSCRVVLSCISIETVGKSGARFPGEYASAIVRGTGKQFAHDGHQGAFGGIGPCPQARVQSPRIAGLHQVAHALVLGNRDWSGRRLCAWRIVCHYMPHLFRVGMQGNAVKRSPEPRQPGVMVLKSSTSFQSGHIHKVLCRVPYGHLTAKSRPPQ